MHDRHRRLRRNSVRGSEQVAIEHNVASNNDVSLGKIRNMNGHGMKSIMTVRLKS